MRLVYKHIDQNTERSLLVRRDHLPCLDDAWHFHPEYELILIVRGHGRRFVGDSMGHFDDGELALVGPSLPHLWRNDPASYDLDASITGNNATPVDVVIVQFRHDFLGEDFFTRSEMLSIATLLDRSARGLRFVGRTSHRMRGDVATLPDRTPFEQVYELLKILHVLADSDESIPLATSGFVRTFEESDSERMNNVISFLINHFQENTTLRDAASAANLSVGAFCRYVKQCTGKTYSQLLNEMRVGHACMLLTRGSYTIAQVAYESGYRSLTNFNRQFKRIREMTPSTYRSQHRIAS